MAVNDYETSIKRGQPVNLYTFDYGVGLKYRYTDHETDILWNGDTYTATPVEEPQSLKSRGDLSSGKFELTVPKTSAIATLFLVYPPTQPVVLTRRQGHVANADDPAGYASGVMFAVAWTGRILDTERGRNTVTLYGDSAAAAVGRPGLRRHYQRTCAHVLYGTGCGASKANATHPATVSAIAGNKITLNAGWLPVGFTYSDFETGTVSWTSGLGSEVRTIMRMTSSEVLYVDALLRDLAPGDPVSMILKCARTVENCRRLHNNIVNFGGQPYIPRLNPVGKNNHT